MHLGGEKFATEKEMGVQACNPPPFLKQGDKLVPNTETEGQALLQRPRSSSISETG